MLTSTTISGNLDVDACSDDYFFHFDQFASVFDDIEPDVEAENPSTSPEEECSILPGFEHLFAIPLLPEEPDSIQYSLPVNLSLKDRKEIETSWLHKKKRASGHQEEDDGQTTLKTEHSKKRLDGWLDQMIPSSPTTHIPHAPIPNTPPSTPLPRRVTKLPLPKNRPIRHHQSATTYMHYQTFYRDFENEASSPTCAAEHLSNEQWVARRERRERLERLRTRRHCQTVELAVSDTLAMYNGTQQQEAMASSNGGDILLHHLLPQDYHPTPEFSHDLAAETEQTTPSTITWQQPRRLVQGPIARRERLLHLSSSVVQTSWRIASFPFRTIYAFRPSSRRRSELERTDTVGIRGGPAVALNFAAAFETAQGWSSALGNSQGRSPAVNDLSDDSHSTAFWSTGTAVASDVSMPST